MSNVQAAATKSAATRNHPYALFDELFSDFFRNAGSPSAFQPRVDLRESAQGYQLGLEIPGVKKEDITLEVKEGQLVVQGEKKNADPEEGVTVLRQERIFGRFERRFQLPKDVNIEQIEARFNDGVLNIYLQKSEQAQPRKISVS